MNIYEKGSNRSDSRCSYCRTTGHNIRDCPQVAKDYAYWRDYKVPLQAGNPCSWYSANSPKYWGEWYTKCINAMQRQLDYKDRQKSPKKRVIKDRKCGFCGGGLHTRRNCSKMKQFLDDAYTANANWRKAAYDLLVNQYGISVGAAIKVQEASYYGGAEQPMEIGLITAVNWDKLNFTCANPTWEDRYRQSLSIQVLVKGKRKVLAFDSKDRAKMKGTINHIYGYGSLMYCGKVAPARHPLEESWIHDYKEAFDFLAKKRTLTQLREYGLVSLVEKWKGE